MIIMSETITEIELKRIHPNKLNPRLSMNIEELNALADSIRKTGLLQPLIVRPFGDFYEVVVGERRYRAAQNAGLEKVPAIIRKYSDDEVIELNMHACTMSVCVGVGIGIGRGRGVHRGVVWGL